MRLKIINREIKKLRVKERPNPLFVSLTLSLFVSFMVQYVKWQMAG